MIEHTITFHGPEAVHGKLRSGSVGPLLTMLEPAVRDNLRLAFFSSSRIKGRPQAPLKKASEVRLTGLRDTGGGATELVVELPLLRDAAPAFYDQMEFWDDAPKPEETALDILGYTLADIAGGVSLSNRFDPPLLGRIHRLGKILGTGITQVTLGGHFLSKGRAAPPISRQFIDTLRDMIRATPAPRRVRVHGTLDMVRCSDRSFEVVTYAKERLRAAWTPADLAPLKEYLNRAVLIEGQALFRPSGTVLRVDADAIRPALREDAFFSNLPRPAAEAAPLPINVARKTAAHNGYEGIAGTWPGDESIGELLDTLQELGR